MAWPWLAIVARTVPWGELVRRTPDIIAASRKLLEKNKTPEAVETDTAHTETTDHLRNRVDTLEARDEEHAKIIEQMAEQIQGLTVGLEVLAARNRLLIWVVGALAVVLVVGLLALR